MQRKAKELGLPAFVNPFDGVGLEKEGSTRYISTIHADELLKKAKKDLRKKDPDSWKVILLALSAGLRRAEIDGLGPHQLDPRGPTIHVMTHEHFETKTDESTGGVHVELDLLEELKVNLDPTSVFVVEPQTPPANGPRAPGYYRCDRTFVRVTNWLRKNGVKADRPIQVLRKEFGSVINAQSDIFTASSQPRHAHIGTTAAFYADNRRRSPFPIGGMINNKMDSRVLRRNRALADRHIKAQSDMPPVGNCRQLPDAVKSSLLVATGVEKCRLNARIINWPGTR